jgi:hypothetical protein
MGRYPVLLPNHTGRRATRSKYGLPRKEPFALVDNNAPHSATFELGRPAGEKWPPRKAFANQVGLHKGISDVPRMKV